MLDTFETQIHHKEFNSSGCVESHLNGGEWRQREKLGHPQFKVQPKAVKERPNVNQFTRSEPESCDSKRADGR